MDIFSKVAGKGIERLQKAGREVVVGVLENECRALNSRFFTFHSKGRPYIILKWAQTRNGLIAPLHQEQQAPVWISNEFSQQLTHLWRAEEGAILVGRTTVERDNPSLTVRHWVGDNPLRLVIEGEHSLLDTFNVFQGEPTVVFSSKQSPNTEHVSYETFSSDLSMPNQVCNYLYDRQIQSLIVEGGAQVLQQFISEGLWDEARIFVGKSQFSEGIKAPLLQEPWESVHNVEGDYLFIYKNLIQG